MKPVKSEIVEKNVGVGAEWEIPAKRGVGCGMLFGLAFCVIPLGILCMMIYGMFSGEVKSWLGMIGGVVFVSVFIAVGGAVAYFGYRSRYTALQVKVRDGGVDVLSKFSKGESTESVAGGDVYGVGLYKSSETNNRSNYGLLVKAREGKDVKFGAGLKEEELRWLASEMLWSLSEQGGLPAAEEMEEMYFSPVAGGKSEFIKEGVNISTDSAGKLMIEKDGSKTGTGMLYGGLFGVILGGVFMGVGFQADEAPLIFGIVGVVAAVVALVIFILGLTKMGTTERYTFESDRILKEKLKKGMSLYKIRFPKKDFSELEVKSSGSSNDEERYSVVLKGEKEKLKLFSWVELEISEVVKFKVSEWLKEVDSPSCAADGGVDEDEVMSSGYGSAMVVESLVEPSPESRAPAVGFTADEVPIYRSVTDLKDVKGGIWLVRAFLGIFLAAGLGLIFSGVSEMMTARDSENWPSVGGVILKSKVTVNSDGEGTTYGTDIRYRYNVDGERYKADGVTVSEVSTSSRSRAQKIVKRYPKKKKVTVFYDPNDPQSSVLETGVNGGSWFMPGMGLVFFCFPLIILVVVEKHYKKSKLEERKPSVDSIQSKYGRVT